MRITTLAKTALPLSAALALAACGGSEAPADEPAAEQTPNTYATDVEDLSGGEIVITQEDPNAVPVELPETPMVPADNSEEVPAE